MIGLVTSKKLLEHSTGTWVASQEDRTLATCLAGRGLPARVVAWDDMRVDWSAFRLLVIRSTWTSRQHPAEYLAWLRRVDALTTLCNPRQVIEWRKPAGALDQLAAHGVPLAAPPPARPVRVRCGKHTVVLLRDQTQGEWLVAHAWRSGFGVGDAPRSTEEAQLVPTEEEVALAHQTLRAMYRVLGPVMNACLAVRIDLLQEAGSWRVLDVDPHAPRLFLHQSRQATWRLVESIETCYQRVPPGAPLSQEEDISPCSEEHPSARPAERVHTPRVAKARVEWWQGVLAGLPLALSLVPYMGIYAVLSRAAGLTVLETQAMSLLVFSGAQLVATQLLLVGSPVGLIVGIGSLLNARHLLYGATLAPYVKGLPLWWRCLLAYLLTDEAFCASSPHYQQPGNPHNRHWFLFGAGLTVWVAAQGGTFLGSLLLAQLPPSWSLGFTAPLSFIALTVLVLKDRASLTAAVVAGALSLLTTSLPLGLGLVVAALVGILVGVGVEGLTTARPKQKEANAYGHLAAHRAPGGHYLSGAFRLLFLKSGGALASAPARLAPLSSSDAGGTHRPLTAPHGANLLRNPDPAVDRWGSRRSSGLADPARLGDGARGDDRALVASVGVVTPGAQQVEQGNCSWTDSTEEVSKCWNSGFAAWR
jgi:predicted branched-subunit amino acid permease